MIFTVHDVGLGQFITLEHEDQHLICWDAGDSPSFSPRGHLEAKGHTCVDRLFITNFDHDHVSGIVDLCEMKIRSIRRNPSATAEYIRNLKLESGPLSAALEKALEMHENWTGKLTDPDLVSAPRGVEIATFFNSPSEEINDTNNLSMVTILKCWGQKIVVSGDLERKGWDALLKNTAVSNHLHDVDVFVASHHGRENGYHQEVMEIASPSCVVMSDYEVKHATQDTLDLYRRHCSGILLNGATRRVLTTRRDGSISWDFR